jgi:hypothetical protein
MREIEALLARAAVQHGAFSRAQALALGVTATMLRTRLRRGDWPEVAPEVHIVAGSPASWRRELTVATLAPGGPLFASHRSVARLHGLDGFASDPAVEVIGDRGRRPLTGGAVVVHWSRRLTPRCVTEVDGIPALNVATTLVTIAGTCSSALVQQALDEALRQGASPRWLRATFRHFHHPGSRRTRILFEMLAEHEGGAPLPDSWFERMTERLVAVCPDLPPLRRQIPVRRSDGRLALIDLGVPDLRVGIECQSRKHHGTPTKAHRDAVRSRRIDAVEDWDLLPVWWRDLDRGEEVAQAFLAKVARRQRELAGLAAMQALDALAGAGTLTSERSGAARS